MIAELLNQNYDYIFAMLIQLSMMWIAILVAMLIDLYFGIKKSKSLGEHTTSEGFRRSIEKFVYYYSMMTFALIFDFLDVITPLFLPFPLSITPLFSLFCTVALIFTEAKSVREKASDKLRRKTDKSFREVVSLIEKRQDLMNEIIDLIKTKKNENEE